MRRAIAWAALWVALGLFVSGLAIPPCPPPDIVAEVTRVIDGDTIEVHLLTVPDTYAGILREGATERIRYIGVDAPELSEATGDEATQLNAALVQGKTVYLELDENKRDRYGRLLAYVYLDPDGYLMVNLMLVSTAIIGTRAYEGTERYTELFDYVEKLPVPKECGGKCAEYVPWNEAKRHEGETVWVRGPVVDIGRDRNHDVFLNLGCPYPQNCRFTVVIWSRYVSAFESAVPGFPESLDGKTICVFGPIEEYKGIPEIELSDPNNLVILDK